MRLMVVFLLLPLAGCQAGVPDEGPQKTNGVTRNVTLPPGFKMEVFASGIEGARSIAQSPSGTIYVGTRQKNGSVYEVKDTNNDFYADKISVVASGLFMPNGVAFLNGSLFVAEVNRILRFDDVEKQTGKWQKPVTIRDDFSDNTWHGWKFIRVGPDGKLYIPVGMPCNVCEQEDKRFGTIMRMNLDGSELEIFARGVRNSVGFDWDPGTGDLWFTDNGRDNMGDDLPPCELNHAPAAGLHFGFPYIHGKNIPDPEFGKGKRPEDFTPAAAELGAHVAPLGMRFYTGTQFPEKFRNQIFIAEHGSWNRSTKNGYRVVLVTLENGKAVSVEPFADNWQVNEEVFGRPVDVEVLKDGSLLVSDDFSDCLYRIYRVTP